MARPVNIPLDERDRSAIERFVAHVLPVGNITLKIFGSRARGDSRHASDIDLAVVTSLPVGSSEMAELRDMLENSHIPFRVDVVDYASAPVALRKVIDIEGIAWPVPTNA
jgi:hypothetical protein